MIHSIEPQAAERVRGDVIAAAVFESAYSESGGPHRAVVLTEDEVYVFDAARRGFLWELRELLGSCDRAAARTTKRRLGWTRFITLPILVRFNLSLPIVGDGNLPRTFELASRRFGATGKRLVVDLLLRDSADDSPG